MKAPPTIIDGRDLRHASFSQFVKIWAETGSTVLAQFGGKLDDDDFPAFGEAYLDALNPKQRAWFTAQFTDLAQFREELHQVFQVTHWANGGFNIFRLSEDLTTGLLLTEPTPITAEDPLRLPFPCFLVQLPPKTIPIFWSSDDFVWADHLWVHQFRSRQRALADVEPWFRWTLGAKTLRLWRDRPPAKLGQGFVDQSFYTGVEDTEVAHLPQQDDRSLVAALRLVRNLCAWLDHAGGMSKQRQQQRTKKQQKRKKDRFFKPVVWLLGHEVTLPREMTERREDFALGRTRKAPKGWRQRVRHIVQGHWKLQAHGPDRVLRKRKWIEPYWRNLDESVAFGHLYAEKTGDED